MTNSTLDELKTTQPMTDAMIFKERAEIAEMCISELKAEVTRLKEDAAEQDALIGEERIFAQRAIEQARTDLGNLFARIFRDGGQHAASITHDEAMRQADLAVANYIGTTDELKAEIARLREALFMCATHCQGGHSQAGAYTAEVLGVPFPLTMPELSARAVELGLKPADLWPWYEKHRIHALATEGQKP